MQIFRVGWLIIKKSLHAELDSGPQIHLISQNAGGSQTVSKVPPYRADLPQSNQTLQIRGPLDSPGSVECTRGQPTGVQSFASLLPPALAFGVTLKYKNRASPSLLSPFLDSHQQQIQRLALSSPRPRDERYRLLLRRKTHNLWYLIFTPKNPIQRQTPWTPSIRPSTRSGTSALAQSLFSLPKPRYSGRSRMSP